MQEGKLGRLNVAAKPHGGDEPLKTSVVNVKNVALGFIGCFLCLVRICLLCGFVTRRISLRPSVCLR